MAKKKKFFQAKKRVAGKKRSSSDMWTIIAAVVLIGIAIIIIINIDGSQFFNSSYDDDFDSSYSPLYSTNKWINTIIALFQNGTFSVLFFLLFLVVFRTPLRLNQPSVSTIAKICLMIVSSYFSYAFFVSLKMPAFISMIAGIGSVLALQQSMRAYIEHKEEKKKGAKAVKSTILMWAILILGLIFGNLLDVSATLFNLVNAEGKVIVMQEMMDKKIKDKIVETQKMKQQNFGKLIDGENFLNMRVLAKETAKDSLMDKFAVNNKAKGTLRKGFDGLVGEKWGAKIYPILMGLFAISFTLMINVMEIKEGMSEQKTVVVKPTEPKSTSKRKGRHIGFGNEKTEFTSELDEKIIIAYDNSNKEWGVQAKIADAVNRDTSQVHRTLKKYKRI